MALDNRDILFASLVGSKVAEQVPRFTTVQNELMKHVLPPIPFLPLQNETGVKSGNVFIDGNVWTADGTTAYDDQYFPLTFINPNDGIHYLLPYEPLINISGRNNIIKRNVAKMKPVNGTELIGSIKERWSQGDYEITITGFLMGSIMTGRTEDCFPRDDFQFLKEIITAPNSIKVLCEPLQLLGIDNIVVEDFSFPFTKGENVQAYEIKALSDFDYKLLLDIND